jgi:IMP dehydrogenase
MAITITDGLSYDDVLLKPKYSTIKSRSSDVDVAVHMGKLHFSHPIIPANMQLVASKEMCQAVIKSGGLAILHRFMDDKEQLLIASDIIAESGSDHFAISVGVKSADRELINRFYFAGVRIVCIDIAHGDSQHCVEMCQWIRQHNPDMFIIAGNVATGRGAQRLWEAGADVCKACVGSGSLCSTRIQTGNGVPTITTLMDIAETRKFLQSSGVSDRAMYVIADGGIRSAGDIVKALCFSDMVMIGNLFASAFEAPGKRINVDGGCYKEYVGSSTHKDKHIEGIAGLVPYNQESYQIILDKLLQGLRSGCSYQDAHNLSELQEDVEFIRITNSGLTESHPHSVKLRSITND